MWSLLVSSEYDNLTSTGLPGLNMPGGGTRTKARNVRQAGIEVINNVDNCKTPFLLVEPLFINYYDGCKHADEAFDTIMKGLKKADYIKMAWAEEQQLLRWSGKKRHKFLEPMSKLFVCNKYLKQLLSVYVSKPIGILRTPISSSSFIASKKQKRVVAIGKVSPHKCISDVIDLFKELPDSWEKVYIGNAGLWGTETNTTEIELEGRLKNSCDWIPSLSQNEVADIASETFAYVNLARYDVGCLSFLEFAMAGCYCFCNDFHLMFDEYKHVARIHGPKDGANQIIDAFNQYGSNPNKRLRNQMVRMHSFEAFRKQLKDNTKEMIDVN